MTNNTVIACISGYLYACDNGETTEVALERAFRDNRDAGGAATKGQHVSVLERAGLGTLLKDPAANAIKTVRGYFRPIQDDQSGAAAASKVPVSTTYSKAPTTSSKAPAIAVTDSEGESDDDVKCLGESGPSNARKRARNDPSHFRPGRKKLVIAESDSD